MSYALFLTRQAAEDWRLLRCQGKAALPDRAKYLLAVIRENPYAMYPPFKKLKGPLHGLLARRINKDHRLVYQVCDGESAVKIICMWGHYD